MVRNKVLLFFRYIFVVVVGCNVSAAVDAIDEGSQSQTSKHSHTEHSVGFNVNPMEFIDFGCMWQNVL